MSEANLKTPVDALVIRLHSNPTKDQAIEACLAWFEAEDKNLGTFHDKMDLCAYAEWALRKASGQDVGEFKGVPKLILSRG